MKCMFCSNCNSEGVGVWAIKVNEWICMPCLNDLKEVKKE